MTSVKGSPLIDGSARRLPARKDRVVSAVLTRKIALGLIALRVGVHLVLAVIGAPVTSAAGHLALAVAMAGATVMLWFNQRVTFRALGLA